MIRRGAFWAALLWVGAAQAQTVSTCDWPTGAEHIAEPWEQNTATYADGAVRIAVLDTIEPDAAPFHILLLHPPYNYVGQRTCTVISRSDGGTGFPNIFFEDRSAHYDPVNGLTISIPAVIYLPEQSFQNTALLQIRIDQATGEVDAHLDAARD